MNEFPVSHIYSEVTEQFKYRAYLTDVFEDERSHIEVVEILRAMQEDDEMHLHITSPGGLVSVADMYIQAIRECKGTVFTHGVGGVASAAVIIFLAGHVRIPEKGSSYMMHNVQYGVEGDSANIKVHVDFSHRLFKEKFYDTYKQILTEAELSELFDRAGEIYLTASEMEERLLKAEEQQLPTDYVVQLVKSGHNFGTVVHSASGSIGCGYTVDTDMEWVVVAEYRPSKGVAENIRRGDMGEDIDIVGEGAEERKESLSKILAKQKEDLLVEEGDDVFSVTLEDGFKKQFRLSELCPADFAEYNKDEIDEIAEAFGTSVRDLSYSDAVEHIIDVMLGGDKD